MNHQFIKIKTVSPILEVANPQFNVKEMIKHLKNSDADIIAFPELSLTSASCKDLFFHQELISDAYHALEWLLENNPYSGFVVLGMPVLFNQQLINAALLIHQDELLGVVPKKQLSKTDKRWFSDPTMYIDEYQYIEILGDYIPFGELSFVNQNASFSIGFSHQERHQTDVSIVIGALANVHQQDEQISALTKAKSLNDLQSTVFVSAGANESSSDGAYIAHHMVYQYGQPLVSHSVLSLDPVEQVAWVDLGYIRHLKRNHQQPSEVLDALEIPEFQMTLVPYQTFIDPLPFVPKNQVEANRIFLTQVYALAKRLKHIQATKIVIGISGGVDSTLALLVSMKAFEILNLNRKDIHAYTLPGLHTSKHTKNNAIGLIKSLGVSFKELDLAKHIKDHLSLIGHDGVTEDVAYENSQARMRTNVLMNIANMVQALFVGTGDMSESALGWSTYNGDQMSMYNPNAGVPKTTIRYILKHFSGDEVMKTFIDSILETPITPELKSNQQTESSIGKYEINDFILYRFIICGDTKERIEAMLPSLFNLSETEAKAYLDQFTTRFYQSQFKRQASPDGPKVFANGLKANADFLMNADVKR